MRKTNSLKAFFIMCLLYVVGTLGAWAQTTVTFVAGTDKGEKTSLTKEGITITVSNGDLSRTDNYRIYASKEITIQSSVGNIRNITFTCTGKDKKDYGPGNLKGETSGSYSFSGTSGTWKGDAKKVSLTASSLVRATKIEVTYVAEGTVLSPSISEPSKTFSESFDVTLSSAEGTNIYYTLDGNVPTTGSTKYNGSPIRIPAATTTLKAIAEKDGKTSKVAEATYTYKTFTTFANFLELKDKGEKGVTYILKFTDAVVTYVKGKNAFIEDATGGILVFQENHGLKAGQKLNGTAKVTFNIFNGTYEITTLNINKSNLIITEGADIPTTEVTIAHLLANKKAMQSKHVKIVDAKITAAFSNGNASIEQDGNSLDLYLKIKGLTSYSNFKTNDIVDVTGFAAAYNEKTQITIWEEDQVKSTRVDAPTLSETTKTFYAPFDVTITATEGANIYYTLNGETPTINSTKYEGAITISSTTTLKAIAEKDGKTSEVAEATYIYSETKVGDGSFEYPYSPEEILKMTNAPAKKVWVKGEILGEASTDEKGHLTSFKGSTSMAIGKTGKNNNIAIQIPEPWRNIITDELIGKDVSVYGKISIRNGKTGGYFGRNGVKDNEKLAGIASIKIKTQEGYATAVIKAPFVVPGGMICSIITDAKDGVLTIENYEAGKVVPAKDNKDVYSGTPVLVKGTPNTEYPLILDKTTTLINSKNLLKAGEGKIFTADADHLYYKLAYDDFNARTDLGFYWGAADGGAFFVPKGSAYLAVPKSAAASVKSFRLEDATTGITAPIASEGQTVKTVYTIDGRRVQNTDHLTKGLYIVNGKKVMIK